MAERTRPIWYRRKYLINPEFQSTIIGFFVGLSVVTILVFFWAFRLVFGNFLDQAREIGIPEGHPLYQLITQQQHAMVWILTGTSVLMFVFLMVGGIILSHQIAGPIFRLTRQLQALLDDEEVSPMAFRKRDFFHELAPLVNQLSEKLEEAKRQQ